MYFYKAHVIEVVEGGMFDMMIDVGFDTWIRRKVRLYGVDILRNESERAKTFVKEAMDSVNNEVEVSVGS